MREPEGPEHMCPSCLVLHRGPAQVCAYCDGLENVDDEDDYDYAEDDFNYTASKELDE